MSIYVNNFLVEEGCSEQITDLIVRIGEKAGMRTVKGTDYLSLCPPVKRFNIDLGYLPVLKMPGDSLRERLKISGFTVQTFLQDRSKVFRGRTRNIRVILKEGKTGIYYRGGFFQRKKARLLSWMMSLYGLEFPVRRLKIATQKQILLQGDIEMFKSMENVIVEWFLQLAKVKAEVPPNARKKTETRGNIRQEKTIKEEKSHSKDRVPDPLMLLDQKSFGSSKHLSKAPDLSKVDTELSSLPLGDNILRYLSSDDPGAKQLQEQIKNFVKSTGVKTPQVDPFSMAKFEEYLNKQSSGKNK